MKSTAVEHAVNIPRVRELLSRGISCLAAAGIDSARLDAEILLGKVLAMTREQLIVAAHRLPQADQVQSFEALVQRRLRREPVAHIIGRQEFWSLEFQVTRDVLIPRPETERLVEVALQLAAPLCPRKPLRILDMGTGSGAVAVSMAKELPWARFYATDIVPSALAIARHNAILHGVADRITFRRGDLFAAVADQERGFDLIVANPPYIRRAAIATLITEVRQWEPRTALDGGDDGLDFYRRIAADAGRYLAPKGAIALEIGADTGPEVLSILMQGRLSRDSKIVHDYAGRERVALARAAPNLARAN